MNRKTIIVDLDGTVCDIEHRLHYITTDDPQDWDAFFLACSEDKPNWPVIEAVQALHRGCFNIVICTGRSKIAEQDTREWLARYGISYSELYMRGQHDRRPDYVIKQQWLDDIGADNVLFTFEDRQSVVDMWRENGVSCFQVAPGDF